MAKVVDFSSDDWYNIPQVIINAMSDMQKRVNRIEMRNAELEQQISFLKSQNTDLEAENTKMQQRICELSTNAVN